MEKDTVRDGVREFYGNAAAEPQAELCCPGNYAGVDLSYIPDDIVGISYGCGSPVGFAGLRAGETVVDLGSGGGIDCFVAAKEVGASGRVVGIDMTDEMLEKARSASSVVAESLGFSNVEFKKGVLEDLPLEDGLADMVMSNCVINLSSDKERVMKEVMRVLKSGGRFCISDVVSEVPVPEEMRADEKLWGECISGAITEEEFFNAARAAGAYGLYIQSRTLYRVAGGLKFFSIVVNGYKLDKGEECKYQGHRAIYNGPFDSVSDGDGHEFAVGVPVEVCTDTLKKLARPPYAGRFSIIDPNGELVIDPVDEGEPCNPAKPDDGSGGCC